MAKSLASEWAEFEERVLPANCSDVQRTETRRGFYAGAISMFHLLMSDLTPGDEPQQADLDKMDALHAEIQAYAAELGVVPPPGGRG